MTIKTLEEDIQSASKSSEEKAIEIDNRILDLEDKIAFYTKWAWGFVIGGFVISIVGILFYIIGDIESFNLNLLGDFYGGSVASIWSLAGLFFIYVAFLGQKQQLLNQQKEIMFSQLEIKYTRLELEGQKKEMIEQNQTLSQQKFDNVFFQLLNANSKNVNSMNIRKTDGMNSVISEGRDCFKMFYDRLEHYISKQNNLNIVVEKASLGETLEGYNLFFEKNQNNLGHYFRTLYHIIKYIDESDIKNKKTYTNFLRAQLSSHELVLLFYNCLSENGIEKFKPFIEKFSLLKNMSRELIFNSDHGTQYDDRAYGEIIN